jgi:hypothetical protein
MWPTGSIMKRDRAQSLAASISNPNSALALLLLINLFNYVDRQVLAAVVGPINREK